MLIQFGEGYVNKDYIAHLFKIDDKIITSKDNNPYKIVIITSIDGWTKFGEKFENESIRNKRFNDIINELKNK